MQGQRIVHGGRYAAALQLVLDALALRGANCVLAEHADAIALHADRPHVRRERREHAVVGLAELDPALELPLQALELGEDHGALDSVHAAADADAGVVVAPALAVVTDLTERRGERVVVGEDRAAVAVAAERLRGEEAA